MMKGYNCEMTIIEDCLRVKLYGKVMRGESYRKSKSQRLAEIEAIYADRSTTGAQRQVYSAILEPPDGVECAVSRPDRTPKERRLTLAERERFSHLMDRNFSLGHKFITLTYEQTDVTLDGAAKDYENWVKRMRERYGDFKYLAIRSFQKRGTLHFHLLADLPAIPRTELADGTFRDIWGLGSVELKRIYSLPMEERRNKLKLDLLKNLRDFKADERYKKLGEIKFDNKPSAFPLLVKEVKKHTKKGMSAVYGLEDVSGFGRALAVYLVEAGLPVKEVNPSLATARRKSHVTVQKSDSWDAECVARVLKDELPNLPDAKPIDLYWAISQLVTQRKWIARNQTGLVRKLHQQLGYHYPSYKKFFSEIDGKTALCFWRKYPSPGHLNGVTVDELAAYLRKLSNYALSTKKAEQILTLVREDGDTTRDFQEKRDFIVQGLVRNIRFNLFELSRIEEQIEGLMKELGYQLETMTGIELVTAAELVAEIGDIHRFATPDKLARFAGVAPITVGSGNRVRNYKSKQGNRELHDILKALAIRQIAVTRTKKEPRNPYFHAYYERKMAEGKTKQQAIVCIMRKLVNVIYVMMRTKAAYVMPVVPEKDAG